MGGLQTHGHHSNILKVQQESSLEGSYLLVSLSYFLAFYIPFGFYTIIIIYYRSLKNSPYPTLFLFT